MFIYSQSQQACADQRTLAQVEWLSHFFLHQPLHFYLFLKIGASGQVLDGKRQGRSWTNELGWLPVNYNEGRAQRFVTPHYFIETSAQGLHVQLAHHSQSPGNVVSRSSGFQLIEKPQP